MNRPDNGDDIIKLLEGSREAARLYSSFENELFIQALGGSNKVMVASAQPGEGKSLLVVLFALYSAKLNQDEKVLVVDADLVESNLSSIFHLGESACSNSNRDDLPAIYPTQSANIDYVNVVRDDVLMPSGAVQINPQKIKELFEELDDRYRLMVINPPPSSLSNNVFSLSTMADQTIIAVKQRGAKRQQLNILVSELRRLGTPVMGVVITERKYHIPRWLYV